jgi:hypothetical protein
LYATTRKPFAVASTDVVVEQRLTFARRHCASDEVAPIALEAVSMSMSTVASSPASELRASLTSPAARFSPFERRCR